MQEKERQIGLKIVKKKEQGERCLCRQIGREGKIDRREEWKKNDKQVNEQLKERKK